MNRNRYSKEPVGIPRALLFHESPLWLHFLKTLGIEVVLSDPMNPSIISPAKLDLCFPVKAALGHIKNLANKGVKKLLIPAVIEQPGSSENNLYSCPYIQSFSDFTETMLPPDIEIISPAVPRGSKNAQVREALRYTANKLNYIERDLDKKIRSSIRHEEDFKRKCKDLGSDFINNKRQPGVVLFARPYVIDASSGLDIPGLFEKLGVAVLPYDFLSFDDSPIPAGFEKNTWAFGLDYLRAAGTVLESDNLFPVVISSFGCGPDSFFTGYLRMIFHDKPRLELDIDEHQSEEGLRTRIEAFSEIIKEYSSSRARMYNLPVRNLKSSSVKDRTIYIPSPCDQYAALAAALNKGGFKAEILPHPDEESESLARRYATGKECYPFILFAGDMLRLVNRKGFKSEESAFLVLGGGTSCRGSEFGRGLIRILSEIGVDMPVLDFHISPKENEFLDLFGHKITRDMWRYWVAIDYLQKLLYEVRPFEKNRGEADELYKKSLSVIIGSKGLSGFKNAAHILSEVAPLDVRKARLKEKVTVGIIGEQYLTINPYANNNLAGAIEELGGLIYLPSHFNDYVLYSSRARWKKKTYSPLLFLQSFIQASDEKEIGSIFAPHLLNYPEPEPDESFKQAAGYIMDEIDPIAVLHVAKAFDFAQKKVDGFLNVMPLGCMLSYIPTFGAYDKICKDYKIQRLDLRMDGLCHTGERTRLESFMDLLWERKR